MYGHKTHGGQQSQKFDHGIPCLSKMTALEKLEIISKQSCFARLDYDIPRKKSRGTKSSNDRSRRTPIPSTQWGRRNDLNIARKD